MVSSSNNEGTKMLQDVAPASSCPSSALSLARRALAPGREDPTVIPFLEDLLAKRKYVAIGEFHIYGADADLPNMRAGGRAGQEARPVPAFAFRRRRGRAPLPAGPERARAVGAFGLRAAGERARDAAQAIRPCGAISPSCTSHASNGKVAPGWREAFLEFPDRFVVGTDTFTPERWHYSSSMRAGRASGWRPAADVAEKIASRTASACSADGAQ